ncbi:Uncharacterised protein [Mycobacteroides abscessus subsp. abscessus]|nr:Uncharacterised protein [Mycobacteroides abscessus subsp. abscessus]
MVTPLTSLATMPLVSRPDTASSKSPAPSTIGFGSWVGVVGLVRAADATPVRQAARNALCPLSSARPCWCSTASA